MEQEYITEEEPEDFEASYYEEEPEEFSFRGLTRDDLLPTEEDFLDVLGF